MYKLWGLLLIAGMIFLYVDRRARPHATRAKDIGALPPLEDRVPTRLRQKAIDYKNAQKK